MARRYEGLTIECKHPPMAAQQFVGVHSVTFDDHTPPCVVIECKTVRQTNWARLTHSVYRDDAPHVGHVFRRLVLRDEDARTLEIDNAVVIQVSRYGAHLVVTVRPEGE